METETATPHTFGLEEEIRRILTGSHSEYGNWPPQRIIQPGEKIIGRLESPIARAAFCRIAEIDYFQAEFLKDEHRDTDPEHKTIQLCLSHLSRTPEKVALLEAIVENFIKAEHPDLRHKAYGTDFFLCKNWEIVVS